MMKKFIQVASSLLMTVLAIVLLNGAVSANSNNSGSNNVKVTYTLKQGNKTFANKKVTQKKGSTVLTGLKKNWQVKESKNFITSIDGKKENQSKKIYWTYKVNGKTSNKMANQQKVHNNDHVVFTLSKTSKM